MTSLYQRAEAIRRCLAAIDQVATQLRPDEMPVTLVARAVLRRELVRIEARAA